MNVEQLVYEFDDAMIPDVCWLGLSRLEDNHLGLRCLRVASLCSMPSRYPDMPLTGSTRKSKAPVSLSDYRYEHLIRTARLSRGL